MITMADSIIERQAIRAALALAVASAHGQVADAIADMRDEAAQLIGLCVHDCAPDAMRLWCDDASALVERLSSDGHLPRHPALRVATAILRRRLAVVRKPVADAHLTSDALASTEKKKTIQPIVRPAATVEGNQKVVMEFIAAHPDIRTKDLTDALKGTFSSRTVKRCLKELCDAGLLHRTKQDDRSVVYRVDR